MTGYARISFNQNECDYIIEIKSVNSKGLDIRTRLTSKFDNLEQAIRKKASSIFKRGSINISISFNKDKAQNELMLNEQALETVFGAIKKIKTQAIENSIKIKPPTIDGILALNGVLERRDNIGDESEIKQLQAEMLKNIVICLDDLLVSRQLEGERLQKILSKRIDEIAALTQKAENHPSRTREVITRQLKLQISELSDSNPSLSEDRLNQEALLLATKADIREELDRLVAHVKAARELLKKGGVIGRKLDFLSQEFNREANTLCSKSNAVALTAIGLDLKLVIDQLREQVQNIE